MAQQIGTIRAGYRICKEVLTIAISAFPLRCTVAAHKKTRHGWGKYYAVRTDWRAVVCYFISFAYAVSFFLPVRVAGGIWGDKDATGATVFLRGLYCIYSGNSAIAWYAIGGMMLPNALFWLGMACLWRRLSVLAFLLGLIAAADATVWVGWVFSIFVQLGHDDRLTALSNPGICVWISSMIALSNAGFVSWLNSEYENPSDDLTVSNAKMSRLDTM